MFSLVALSLLMVAPNGTISLRAGSSPREIEVQLTLDHAVVQRLRETDAELAGVLAISIEGEGQTDGLPIFATYTWRDDTLILRPRYRLSAGVTYVVKAHLPSGATSQLRYRVPKAAPGPPPRVAQVFPSSSTLPANCLKFYIHFTRPMRQGREIFDQIQLVDDRGDVVHDPWRRTELWNAAGDRLTLWIHPGRIKQGVNLREEFGPVLKPDRRYSLVVTDRVRDLAGVPLAKPHVKAFIAAAEDHQRPDLRRWKLNAVRIGSRDPLVVALDKPLDRALLMRMVTVNSGVDQIKGSVAIGEAETTWAFTPERPWSGDQATLIISDRLEDLAGNTPTRLFDTDLTHEPLDQPTLRIPIAKLPRRATGEVE